MPFTPLDEDDVVQDDYKGGSGWVVVAVGEGGRSCIVAIDPGFGAMRFSTREHDLNDPNEAGLDVPDDMGVYRARASYWARKMPDGDNDSGFNVLTEWEDLRPEGFAPKEETDGDQG